MVHVINLKKKPININTYIYLYFFTCINIFIILNLCTYFRASDMEKRAIFITIYIYLYISPVHFYMSVYTVYIFYLCMYGSSQWHGKEDNLNPHIHIPVHFYLSVYLSLTSVGMVRAIDMERNTIYITTYIYLYILPVHFYLSVYITSTSVGMVRAIDMERKTIYITTPLSLVDLVYVNTLIRGSSNVPQQIFTEQITRVGYSTYLCTRPWQRFSEQIFLVGLLQSYLKGS